MVFGYEKQAHGIFLNYARISDWDGRRSKMCPDCAQTLGKHGPYDERGLTPKAVDCLIKSSAKKALIQKRIHPHVMRHTFATTLLDNGNDLKTVQSLMGHSHIRTTERYLHSTDDRKVEAIQSLQFGV
jgi:site-specific recombinase XerC